MSKYASLVANCCKIRKIQLRLVTFANFVYTVFVLSAGKITIFEPNVVILPRVIRTYYIFVLRAVNIYYIYKICELHRAIFPSFYNIQQPIFAVLLNLRRSFQVWCWFSLFLLTSANWHYWIYCSQLRPPPSAGCNISNNVVGLSNYAINNTDGCLIRTHF